MCGHNRVIPKIEDGGCKNPSDDMGAAAMGCKDLRGSVDLVAGDTEVIELAVGEMRQLTDGRAVPLVSLNPGKNKSDEHGNSPFEAEAMVALTLVIVPSRGATKQA
jgi:hypothetical protein